MCTAISYKTRNHYFGRNLDLEYAYQETVTVTPRNFPFHFRRMGSLTKHYAMIGMATVAEGYPLYYEATNEMGLSMAGLNFPRSARYLPEQSGKDNLTPFEFTPWILGQCATTEEARSLVEQINLVNIPFSKQFPLSPLHWMIADSHESIVAEPMADGLRIHNNPIGVLTNEPPFEFHLYDLRNHMHLSIDQAENRFCAKFPMEAYSSGMGSMGLPGDFSSASRFVRAAFVKLNSVSGEEITDSISQFFHILSSVAMPRGCVRMEADTYEITRYSCCCDTNHGVYYYTTYDNRQIVGIDMHREDLDGCRPISYPLATTPQIQIQN